MICRPFLVGFVTVSGVALLSQFGCAKRETVASSAKPIARAEHPITNVAATPDPACAAKKISFNEHIQPLLAENCYACHGADPGSRKADLRLDRAEHAFRK